MKEPGLSDVMITTLKSGARTADTSVGTACQPGLQLSPALHRRESRSQRRDACARPSATRSASPGPSRSSDTGAPSATAASPARRRPRRRSTRISPRAPRSRISISCSSSGAATCFTIPRRRDAGRRGDARLRVLIVDTCHADERMRAARGGARRRCPTIAARSCSPRARPTRGRARTASTASSPARCCDSCAGRAGPA